MGNRAYVVFADENAKSVSPAVYLHWNGGPESVYAFLDELNRRKVRADQNYECARFIAIVSEFFDQDGYGGSSLGVVNGPSRIALNSPTKRGIADLVSSASDNGLYVVTRGEKMKVRRFISTAPSGEVRELTPEQVQDEEKTARKSTYFDEKEGIASKFVRAVLDFA